MRRGVKKLSPEHLAKFKQQLEGDARQSRRTDWDQKKVSMRIQAAAHQVLSREAIENDYNGCIHDEGLTLKDILKNI